MDKNWLLRAEYRYISFDVDRDRPLPNSADVWAITNTSTNSFSRDADNKFDFHVGKIGVVYRFCYCD